jgi:SAM-dependent methyltransferase
MHRLGWEAWGVETSVDGAALARQKPGLRIQDRPLPECGLPAAKFDVVTLWHSLEHVGNPKAYLDEIRRILKQDGILFLAVPNVDGLEFRLFGGNWFHLDLPRHQYQFSPRTLEMLLNVSGMETIHISHYSWEYNPYGFFQSALNALSMEKNFLYKLLKGFKRPNPKGTISAVYDWMVCIVFGPVLIPIAFIYCGMAAVLGLSGCIEVYAGRRGDS